MNYNPLDLLGGRPSGSGHSPALAHAASAGYGSEPAQRFISDLAVVLRQEFELLLQILGQLLRGP